jgi:choline-sulfatase
MKPSNVLFILSDQHNPKVMGCAGHPIVHTPHLDALAARGTRFSAAYTNSPICVPARASLATGRYVHQIRYWDNANPYDGRVPAWGHRLREAGHSVVSIGKLHYRDTLDDNGFDEEIIPMHVVDGIGDLLGLIRDKLPRRNKGRNYVIEAGGGESTYTRYDQDILAESLRWLREEAPRHGERPWVLFASFVNPHPPMIAPEEFYGLYPHDKVPFPIQYWTDAPLHPAVRQFRDAVYWDRMDDAIVRKAVAAYLGQVSFLDHSIGALLGALEQSGLGASTRVIYSSDHGENLGNRGLWNKSVMYEDAAGIPLLMAGPDVPAGQVLDVPVSLVDVFPTVMEMTGTRAVPADAELPGHSLLAIANGARPQRTVLSEYHAGNSTCGNFMIRHGPYKFVYYTQHPAQLFNLEHDPEEVHDLAADPARASLLAECEARLRSVVDPEAADALARSDQGAAIARHGGREAVIKRGTFGYTPAPGETPVFK